MALTSDDILKHCGNGHPAETVTVPEWGGDIYLREPSRHEVELAVKRHGVSVMSTLGPKLLELCLCNEDGSRMFADGKLPAIPARAGARLVDRCRVLCGLLDEDEQEQLVGKDATTGTGD